MPTQDRSAARCATARPHALRPGSTGAAVTDESRWLAGCRPSVPQAWRHSGTLAHEGVLHPDRGLISRCPLLPVVASRGKNAVFED